MLPWLLSTGKTAAKQETEQPAELISVVEIIQNIARMAKPHQMKLSSREDILVQMFLLKWCVFKNIYTALRSIPWILSPTVESVTP